MKLKVKTRILFVSILLAALAMGGCDLNNKKREVIGLSNHQDPTGGPADTFWAASGHTFLVIPTAIVIIVDEKGSPVNKAGIIVSAHYGNGNITNCETSNTGTAAVQILGLIYPFTVTASDGGLHQFSTATIPGITQLQTKITIVESPLGLK